MKKSNAFKYIFIIVIIILGIVTYSIYQKEKKTDNDKSTIQENDDTANVVKELRLAISGLDTINPIISSNKHVQEISKIIFDPLITFNDDFTKEYALAQEVSKLDDITYVIKLKENIKWSDGTILTANDVEFTIQLLQNIGSVYSNNVQNIVSIEKLDDLTLKITLDQTIPFFEYNLTFPIMSATYYDGFNFQSSERTNLPIGTGMFKIVSYDEKAISLEKNTEYWNQEKNSVLEKININIYQTMGEVYNDFKNGNIDTINTSQTSVNQYIGTIGFAAVEFDSREYDCIIFNNTNNFLSSKNVRKALSYYIDKNNTIASCYGNTYRVSDFPLDYGHFLYAGGIIDNGYNSEIANNLLVEDGWVFRNNSWQKASERQYVKLAFTLTINGDNALDIAIAENLRIQWANVGITVTVKQVSTQSYYDMLGSRTGYDAILANMLTSYTPNINSYMGSLNMSNYNNNEVNQILQEVNNITDNNLLKEKYRRVIEIYNDEKPFLSIARKKNLLTYNTNLTGYLRPTAYNIYNHIEKWYRKNY